MDRLVIVLPIAVGVMLAIVISAAATSYGRVVVVLSLWGVLGLPLSLAISAVRASSSPRSSLLFAPMGLLSYYLGVVASAGILLVLFATVSFPSSKTVEAILSWLALLVGSFIGAAVFLFAHRRLFGSPAPRYCLWQALVLSLTASALWVLGPRYLRYDGITDPWVAVLLPAEVLLWYVGLSLSAGFPFTAIPSRVRRLTRRCS